MLKPGTSCANLHSPYPAKATPSSAERFVGQLMALPDTLIMTASSFAEALDQSRSALSIITHVQVQPSMC